MYIICLDSQLTSSTQIKHQWQENTIRKHNFPICPCASVLLQKVSDWILTGQDRSVGYTPPRYWFCIAWQQKRSNRPTLSWICIVVFFPCSQSLNTIRSEHRSTFRKWVWGQLRREWRQRLLIKGSHEFGVLQNVQIIASGFRRSWALRIQHLTNVQVPSGHNL